MTINQRLLICSYANKLIFELQRCNDYALIDFIVKKVQEGEVITPYELNIIDDGQFISPKK